LMWTEHVHLLSKGYQFHSLKGYAYAALAHIFISLQGSPRIRGEARALKDYEKVGSVAGLGARLNKTREQEPVWPGLILFPCNDLPDIQSP